VPIPTEPITPENVDQIQELAIWGKGRISQVAYSPDGKVLAVGTTAGVWLYDAETLNIQRFIQTEREVLAMAFSPGGETITVHLEGDVRGQGGKIISRWNVETGELEGVWQVGVQNLWRVVFAPDGKNLASVLEDGQVGLWDIESGRLLAALGVDSDPRRRIGAPAFSPDGKLLASEGPNLTIRLWAVETGQLVRTLSGHPDAQMVHPTIRQLTFSPDGRLLGSEADVTRVWNVEMGELLYTLEGQARGMVFSPDGDQIATDGEDSVIQLWEVESGQRLQTLVGHSRGIIKLTFSPDDAILASAGGDKTVRLWNIETGSLQATLEGYTDTITDIVVSPNDTIFVSYFSNPEIQLWDVRSGQIERTLTGHTKGVVDLSLSADGTKLASRERDASAIWIWDVTTGEPVQTLEKQFRTLDFFIALSPDGQLLVVSEGEIFDLQTGIEKYHLRNYGKTLTFSSDSKVLAFGTSDGIILWNVETGDKLLPDFIKGGVSPGEFTPFSVDNKIIATGSGSRKGSIELWDVETGENLYNLVGHPDEQINSLAFLPGPFSAGVNMLLASSSRGNAVQRPTVRFWEIETGYLLNILDMPSESDIRFTSDGRILVLGLADGTIQLWGIPPE
jgi:WD40 repeat protein